MSLFANKPFTIGNSGGSNNNIKFDDNSLSNSSAWSSEKINNELSKKANSLNVYSKDEVDRISRLVGTKDVDEANIGDGRVLMYNGDLDKYILVDLQGGSYESNDINYVNNSYPTISSVKEALDKVMYVEPQILSFTSSIATVEKGSSINSLELNWSLNKDVISQSIDNGIGLIDNLIRTKEVTGVNITSNTTYTLTIDDGFKMVSKSCAINFMQKRYWGVNSKSSLNNQDVLSLNSEFSSNRNQIKTIDGNGGYIYFSWPSTFGSPSFKVNGLVNNAWEKQTISLTNSSGYTEIYDVYRSQYIQNGTGINIDIT